MAADLQIMCRGVTLPLEISLDAIVRTHWQQISEDLVLTYRVLSSAEGAAASSNPSLPPYLPSLPPYYFGGL